MKFAAVIEYLQNPEVVQAHRPAHRGYLNELLASGKLAASGPFQDGYGALIIYVAETAEAAEAILKADPFHAAGVFLRWTIRPWNCVFVNPQSFSQPA